MKRNIDWSLYLITDRTLALGRELENVVADAITGGVTAVQIREKKSSTKEFIAVAERILSITREAGIPLIINDRVDVALAVGADGVHLGQDDMPYEIARRLLGPDAIIGMSVTNAQQAAAAETRGDLDYLGIGPIFFTTTKEDLKTPIGFEGLANISRISKHKLVAIGGIKAETACEAVKNGASGVAVVSAIMSASSPRLAAEELLKNVRAS